jgi:hypothetical protein
MLFVALFAAGDFLIQFLRGDPAPTFAGLRIYLWFDVTLLALAVGMLIVNARRIR